jgi:hypothetical protein
VATDAPIHTPETELLTPQDMLLLVIDWTGGCQAAPGNTDIIEVLMTVGVTKEKLVLLAHALTKGVWTRQAAAALVLEMLSSSRVRAAIALHGFRHHGIPLCEARRDVRSLRAEARELVQREILMSVKSPRRRPA